MMKSLTLAGKTRPRAIDARLSSGWWIEAGLVFGAVFWATLLLWICSLFSR